MLTTTVQSQGQQAQVVQPLTILQITVQTLKPTTVAVVLLIAHRSALLKTQRLVLQKVLAQAQPTMVMVHTH